MKTAILTGGTGFLGFWLLKELVKHDVYVYVVVRNCSTRLGRLIGVSGIKIVELDMENISELPYFINTADVFYHLAWEGERNDFPSQMKNIKWAVDSIQAAGRIGVKQFIATGSQAEYGISRSPVDESSPVDPSTAYGASKLACYYLLKALSKQLALPLTWVRVFSVYGEGDNSNTLISYLFKCFSEDEVPKLTKCNQMWDFLYAEDAANALYLLGEKGKPGLYNLASGESRPLKEFVTEVRDLLSPDAKLDFGARSSDNVVELRANIERIRNDLRWRPASNFQEGILKIRSSWDGKPL